jgi:hypothetical protein
MSGPGRGGNLTQPLKKVLLNVPSADNLGMFRDNTTVPGTNLRVLQFKSHGYSLPYLTGTRIRVMKPQDHTPKIVTVRMETAAPADTQNYEYGVNLVKRVRKPGIQNSMYFPHQQYYGGALANVTATTIAAGELNEMRDDIVQQINSDRGYTRRFDYEMPGAPAIASRPLFLESWDVASACWLDNTPIWGFNTIDLFVNAINETDDFAAVRTGTTTLVVVRKTTTNAGNAIVFNGSEGTVSAVAAVNGDFALYQRWPDATYEVKMRPTFATATIHQTTVYELLTADEVFQTFSHIPNRGFLAQEVREQHTPLPGVKYVRINIDVPMDHYDLGGASHQLSFINAVELYIPETEWPGFTARWGTATDDRIMDAGTANDLTSLLHKWTGGALASTTAAAEAQPTSSTEPTATPTGL